MSLLENNYYYQKPTTCETQDQPINIPYIYIYHRVPFYIHITNINHNFDRCLNDFENQYSKTTNGVSYSYSNSILIQ